MYWQVYLHKTVVAAEFMLIHALRRAKELIMRGDVLFGSPPLLFFLQNHITEQEFETNQEVLKNFALLDDYDILGALKIWQYCHDRVLSMLSSGIVNRNLFKIEISRDPYSEDRVALEKEIVKSSFKLTDDEVHYFVYTDVLSNKAYNENKQNINLKMKSGEIMDLSKASDNLNISALAQPVEKFFICYPI